MRLTQTTFDNLEEIKTKFALEETETKNWDKLFEEGEANRKRELQKYLNERPAIRKKLDELVLEFSKDYEDQKVLAFYGWVQSRLKVNFGKNYNYVYFDYVIDELRKKGFIFTIE